MVTNIGHHAVLSSESSASLWHLVYSMPVTCLVLCLVTAQIMAINYLSKNLTYIASSMYQLPF